MSESLSTLDFPLRWAEEIADARDRADTRYFLFAHEEGHLVMRESAREEIEDLGSATTGISSLVKTDFSVAQGLRVPRAKRFSSRHDDRYILLKKYEGFVTTRTNDGFSARLFENTSDYPVLEAEFDLEELSETDRELAVEGAPLVWTIGFRYDGSTRKRESAIYLRRLPRWAESEITQARKETEDLTRGIQWR